MANMFSLLPTIAHPIALTVTLVYVVSLVERATLNTLVRESILGVLFLIGVVAAMSDPIPLAEGIIFDMRSLIIGAAMAFLGPRAGLITLVGAIAMRYSIGGQGVVAGLTGMLLAASGGLLWRYFVRPKVQSLTVSLLCLGGLISIHNLAAILIPEPFRTTYFVQLAPFVFALNLLGSWILGQLLHREALMRAKVSQMKQAAATDPLTDLMNRRSLMEAVAKLKTKKGAIYGQVALYFDVDHFKEVNDTYGHQVGDLVLKEICNRVSGCLRPDDIFSRIGGDEFVVILPNVSPSIGRTVARRCQDAVRAHPVTTDAGKIFVSISMGATWSEPDIAFNQLLKRADRALYAAKVAGRNQVHFDGAFERSTFQKTG